MFRTDQEKERRDIQLSIEKKITSARRLQTMLHLKMYPLPYIWQDSYSRAIKGMMEENFQKNRSGRYHARYIAQIDWSKTAKKFSVNSRGKFLSWHEARRHASKWISLLREILFILLVSCFSNVCCTFHLGKMFIRILSIIFDLYCSFASQLSCITIRLSDGMFLSFAAIAISFSKT